jgi:hypothetical protein
VIAFVLSGACHALVTATCSFFGNGSSILPLERWPFDTVRVTVNWAPACFNFSCVAPPPLVGARAHVEGTVIRVAMYGSDDALPPGVPVAPPPATPSHPSFAAVDLGPLAPGTYTLQVDAHAVTGGVVTDLCRNVDPAVKVTVEQAAGPVAEHTAVEFHNAARDHYFLTYAPHEIADLDGGVHAGWARTGKTLQVFEPNKSGGVGAPTCRFYGLPSAGLDSHFYTSLAPECAAIPGKFDGAWVLESANVFEVRPPDQAKGACGGSFVPVYRLWNRRPDSNHRYTTEIAVVRAMQAQGYVLEGWGPDAAFLVFMCSPPTPAQ